MKIIRKFDCIFRLIMEEEIVGSEIGDEEDEAWENGGKDRYRWNLMSFAWLDRSLQ
ncbi:hypothetical protein PVK06_022475 [Gossypium arboreum]|uniref:Uncharacterized protein n=1 Tax=Gossypium arboreum TaxID=29729 RepID=A0ABR0P8G7_GOSAR|nr:hypothetical protein PVK06_022475 [Gossypium arboreum]